MYMHMYMYMRRHAHAYAYVYEYKYDYDYDYDYDYEYEYEYVYAYEHVYVNAYAYACVDTHVHICIHIYIYVHMYVYLRGQEAGGRLGKSWNESPHKAQSSKSRPWRTQTMSGQSPKKGNQGAAAPDSLGPVLVLTISVGLHNCTGGLYILGCRCSGTAIFFHCSTQLSPNFTSLVWSARLDRIPRY